MMLRDKVVAISGGAGALGQAVARVLTCHGAKVALLDRPVDGPTLEGNCLYIGEVDAAIPADAQLALERVVQVCGPLGALVNVAGGFAYETVEAGSVDTWDRLYHMNLRTAVAMSQAAIPFLRSRGGGGIANVGAAAAQRGSHGLAAYASSKAGVARLTEALADELRTEGITVNAVLPSIIDTPANRAAMPDADHASWVPAVAVGEVIAFLLSGNATSVTGALIPVVNRSF